ncbi:MAG: DUF11 domain-containing protein [Methanosarcinales archaeon]|nr:DUF11 domain-containing protein [Methanosarcinales archaeon]
MSSSASYIMAALGLVLLVQAAFSADDTAPQVLSFDFAPRLLDLRAGDGEIVFTARLRDDESGLAGAFASFAHPQGGSFANVSFDPQSPVSKNRTDGHYLSRLTLPRDSPPGLWRLVSLVLADSAGNRRVMQAEDLEALGFPCRFEVVGDLEGENDSLQISSSSRASFRPTTFQLPGNRTLCYSSRGSSFTTVSNGATGTYLSQEYQYADTIRQVRYIRVDNNGSQMEAEGEFSGQGSWEYHKAGDGQSRPQEDPSFRGEEDYTGSFRFMQRIDEYGWNLQSERSISGQGAASVRQEVGPGMASYQRGTGQYQSQEVVQTEGGYLAKDLSVLQAPFNFSYSPGFGVSMNSSWREGLWSRSRAPAGQTGVDFGPALGQPATSIGQQFSGADRLQVKRVAWGPYQMEMEASFSGRADLRARVSGEDGGELDLDQTYLGEYDLSQKVGLAGASRHDHPRLEVRKEGTVSEGHYHGQDVLLARYAITVTNPGNQPLGPVHVQDLFPPQTTFVNASLRPEELTAQGANWTLTYLPVGSWATIELWLRVDQPGEALVNRVYAAGGHQGGWATAGNYSALEFDWLSCCPLPVAANMSARLDPDDPGVMVCQISFQNRASTAVAATVVDILPPGMEPISASLEPERSGRELRWIFPEVGAGRTVAIEYRARAPSEASFTSDLLVETAALDGSGSGRDMVTVTVPVTGAMDGWTRI